MRINLGDCVSVVVEDDGAVNLVTTHPVQIGEKITLHKEKLKELIDYVMPLESLDYAKSKLEKVIELLEEVSTEQNVYDDLDCLDRKIDRAISAKNRAVYSMLQQIEELLSTRSKRLHLLRVASAKLTNIDSSKVEGASEELEAFTRLFQELRKQHNETT